MINNYTDDALAIIIMMMMDDDDDESTTPDDRKSRTRKNAQIPTHNSYIHASYDSSSFRSVSMGSIWSPPGLSVATMGATAGAGVDDLFAFAACNL